MVPTKRSIRNIAIVLILFVALIEPTIGIWLFHASPLTILIAEFSVIGAAVIGAIAGWLLLRQIFPQLKNKEGEATPAIDLPPASGGVGPLEINVSNDDVLRYYLYLQTESPTLGKSRRLLRRLLVPIFVIDIGAAVGTAVWLGPEFRPLVIALGIVAFLTVLYFIVLPVLLRKTVKAAVVRNYGEGKDTLTGKHHLSISIEGITDLRDTGKLMTNWQAVGWIGSTDQHLFISVRGSSPYIVPRNAFCNDEEFKQFVDRVKSFHSHFKRYQPSD